jgi:hypothetical protein
MAYYFADPDPECPCDGCVTGRQHLEETTMTTSQAATKAADPVKPAVPREVVTSEPLPPPVSYQPEDHHPAAAPKPVPEAPEPTADEWTRELERRRLLTLQGGLEDQAHRVTHLNNKSDHVRGL